MSVLPERQWPIPDDEWDLPNGGASAAKRASVSQHKDWVLQTPASFESSLDRRRRNQRRFSDTISTPILQQSRSIPPAVVTPPLQRRGWDYSKATPATAASTPGLDNVDDDEPIPERYLLVISDAFGSGADLYRDVLCVEPGACPRAIRIAYFRRGREVLTEKPTTTTTRMSSATISGAVTDMAKLRFQAVSMAYEILCNPSWLDSYEKYRLTTSQEDDGVDDGTEAEILSAPSMRSAASTSALRRSSSYGSLGRAARSSSRGGGSVRWNEEVEELVFNQDPDEVGFRAIQKESREDNSNDKTPSKKKKKKGKKKKKKKKQRIAVEADGDDLAKHLEQLDKEAANNFVDDFLDDLERSIDEFLNFKSEDSPDNSEEEEDGAGEDSYDEVTDTAWVLFPETEVEPEVNNTARVLFPETEVEAAPQEDAQSPEPTRPSSVREPPLAPKKRASHHRHHHLHGEEEIEDADFEVAAKGASLKAQGCMTETVPSKHYIATQAEAFRRDTRQEAGRSSRHIYDQFEYESFQRREGHASEEDRYDTPEAQDNVQREPSQDHHSPSFTSPAPLAVEPWLGAIQPAEEVVFDYSQSNQNQNLPPTSPPRSKTTQGLPRQTPLTPPQVQNNPYIPQRSHFQRPEGVVQAPKPQARARFEAPDDIEVTKNLERVTLDDGESAVNTVADSVSTLSASVVQRHINRDLTNSRHKPMDRVQEEDKLNASAEAVVPERVRAASPPPTPKLDSTLTRSPTGNSTIGSNDLLFCDNWCGDHDDILNSPNNLSVELNSEEKDFTSYLMSYVGALSNDLVRMGHSISNGLSISGLMDAVKISEKDLDEMLCVLEHEMEGVVPEDIASTVKNGFQGGGTAETTT